MTGGDDERNARRPGLGGAGGREAGRQARLGAALRANLARRKARARAQAAARDPEEPADTGTTPAGATPSGKDD